MPPDFNPSFQVPNWGWWIVLYFFAGGLTGGVYFATAWLDLFGDQADRGAVRLGHILSLPLIILCSIFLIVDLGQPQRFWHMIFESAKFPGLIIKPYSPMSFGSFVLALSGLVAFLSFVDAVFSRDRWFHRPGNAIGTVLSVLGAIAGLALAGYTGVLLNVNNEPVWGNSPWISALFVFSGISTGIGALQLVARRIPTSTERKLSEADNYMMLFEFITLIVFLVTLGGLGTRFIFGTPTLYLYVVVVVVGLLLPLAIHWQPRLVGGVRAASIVAAVLVLIGGFVLRWAVLASPQGITL